MTTTTSASIIAPPIAPAIIGTRSTDGSLLGSPVNKKYSLFFFKY